MLLQIIRAVYSDLGILYTDGSGDGGGQTLPLTKWCLTTKLKRFTLKQTNLEISDVSKVIISNIKYFIVQLLHTNCKILRLLK